MPEAAKAGIRVGRDRRLDMLRGIALAMIFINHIPGTVYENYTSRNFGFSDAAEGFVLISGISAALAYSAALNRRPLWTGVARIWGRAWLLYLVHLFVMAWVIGIAAGVARFTGNMVMMSQNNLQYLQSDLAGVLVGIPLLTHQLGYVNILPLYTVLLLVSPGLLWLAWRWPVWLVAGSVLMWFIAGTYHFDLPNYPLPGGWFFNPFAWQIIFVIGLLTGVYIRQGKRLVAVRRWLQAISWIYLAFSCVTIWVPPVDHAMGHTLWLAKNAGAPWFFTDFDKTYVTLPRLLHIMALAYLLSSLKVVRWACATVGARPFALLGRQALPVFALGSVLCLGLQALRWTTGDNLLADCLMVFGGLALQFALAAARTWWPAPVRPASAASQPA